MGTAGAESQGVQSQSRENRAPSFSKQVTPDEDTGGAQLTEHR